jgi:hypothetical protein
VAPDDWHADRGPASHFLATGKKDMSSTNHRRSQRHPSYVKKKTVEIGGADGITFAFYDWPAWAVHLGKIEAGEAGDAPLDCPAPFASTTLNQMGFRSDVVERQLSQLKADELRGGGSVMSSGKVRAR